MNLKSAVRAVLKMKYVCLPVARMKRNARTEELGQTQRRAGITKKRVIFKALAAGIKVRRTN